MHSNDAYAFTGNSNVSRSYTSNGLNQLSAAGGSTLAYDANGNLTSDGSTTYGYDSENRLVSASGAHTATLTYDPLGRLWQISSPSGTTRFLYDGDHDVIEMDGSGNIQRAFVFGEGADEPLVWWEGPGPKMLHADERGSIISAADNSGNIVVTNTYDEFGNRGAANLGRFQYTGQEWLPEIGLYYYKKRFYSPELGRFLQTDPIGYDGGPNLYAYVGGDPVNAADPTGTDDTEISGNVTNEYPIVPEYYGNTLVQHSYDWMGQTGTPVSGRLEEIGIDRQLTANWRAANAPQFHPGRVSTGSLPRIKSGVTQKQTPGHGERPHRDLRLQPRRADRQRNQVRRLRLDLRQPKHELYQQRPQPLRQYPRIVAMPWR